MALSNPNLTENIEIQGVENISALTHNAPALDVMQKHGDTSQTELTNPRNGIGTTSQQITAKYPEPLLTEYRLLTRKKRLKQLSEEEQGQLQVVMNTIAELDRADPSAQVWKEKYNELATELQQIRREAEALLAARKP